MMRDQAAHSQTTNSQLQVQLQRAEAETESALGTLMVEKEKRRRMEALVEEAGGVQKQLIASLQVRRLYM